MIVCPNCNHSNPDGAQACENCFTPLPSMTDCPYCGATIQADAKFCGTCGNQLQTAAAQADENETTVISTNPGENAMPSSEEMSAQQIEPTVTTEPVRSEKETEATQTSGSTPLATSSPPSVSVAQKVPATSLSQTETPAVSNAQTQLQQQSARLLHVRTNQSIELPQHLPVIHVGKPNDKVPPDIDVSGFADSDVVSRIHANLRMEGDGYYIEDVGSANGTYINNMPLAVGNRHRLRSGDRISLGKNDLVTFLFQMS
ncbi:MAG: FHA domain-containing protein [Hormoscilla sp.]